MRTDVCVVSRSETTTTCTDTAMLNKFSGTKHTALLKYAVIEHCFFLESPPEWICFDKDPGRGQVSPASLKVPMNR